MANLKSLKSLGDYTPEQRAAIGRKGGIASGKSRRKRKQELAENKRIAAIMQDLLNKPIAEGAIEAITDNDSLSTLQAKNISVKTALGIALIQKGLLGDVKAIETALRIAGEAAEPIYCVPTIISGENALED